MKRYLIAFIISALPLSASALWGQSADSSDVLNDVMVKESFEAGFMEEKLPAAIHLDFSEVVQISERVHWASVDAGAQSSDNNFHLNLQLAPPHLANIRPAPVKTFNLKFSNLQRWKLDITASDGSLFRSLAGAGNPPEQISWDGFSDNGEHLIPGHTYAYSFTAVDKAGNKKTFPGQSFSVAAFYLNYENKLIVGIDPAALFTTDGLRLKPAAGQFAQEAAGLIRYFSTTGKVAVRGRAAHHQEFFDQVLRELVADAGMFTAADSQTKGDHLIFYIE
jgi:hypothetical protein